MEKRIFAPKVLMNRSLPELDQLEKQTIAEIKVYRDIREKQSKSGIKSGNAKRKQSKPDTLSQLEE